MPRISWVLLVGLGAVVACSSAGGPPLNKVDEYIDSLPYLAVTAAGMDEATPSAPFSDGDYSCTSQSVKETRQYDDVVAYAANSDSLYPGALLTADSVMSGLFTQVVLPRAPATISVSLENLGGTKHATIAQPSLSAYRDALSSILDAEITGSTAANLSSQIERVDSQEQLNLALGVQASWGLGIASLKTSFDFSNQNTRSRYVVRYTQAYYTVDMDAPASPSAVLASGIALSDVQAKMDAQSPPVYVSSVTYGRLVVFTFESQYSDEEMSAALNFAYSGGVDVSGNTSVTYKDIISQSTITAYILGGDAGTAVQTIDSYDALIAFIKSGGNYSRQSPGAPIAYKLNYLKDNSPARMSYTSNYDVKNCTRVSQQVMVTLERIAIDSSDELQLYGTATAAGTGTSVASLFDKDSSNFVDIKGGQAFESGLQQVINVSPQPGQVITLHAQLTDHNRIFSDDDVGNETVTVPFETGWRKEVTVTLTGDSAIVRVVFSLTPI